MAFHLAHLLPLLKVSRSRNKNCGAVTSLKKQTISSFKCFWVIRIEKQICPFFFGTTILFRDLLTFNYTAMVHGVNCISLSTVLHSMMLENLHLVEKWWISTTTVLILKLRISDIPFRKRIFTTRIILEQCPARQLDAFFAAYHIEVKYFMK